MKQAIYFEAFDCDPKTVPHDVWRGTATLAAIRKARLWADLSHPLYADEALADADGWACKAGQRKAA